jgi:hypothetical protein
MPPRGVVQQSLIDPAQFYTGIVAELYTPLRSATPDPDIYARFIGVVGEPALELGCGDGDPMIELRRRGSTWKGSTPQQRCSSVVGRGP